YGHSSLDHSSPTLPSHMRFSHQLCSLVSSIPHSSAAITKRPSHSSSAGPSRKRSRSPTTSVPVSSPVPQTLSFVRADLLPPHKRIMSFDFVTYLEDCLDESSESSVPRETSLRDDADIHECIAYVDALRAEGIDARVVVESAREEVETSSRGMVKVRVDRVTHLVVSDAILEPGQEEGVIGVAHETTMPNTRSGVTMTRKAVDNLTGRRVAEALEARDATINLEPLAEGGNVHEEKMVMIMKVEMEEEMEMVTKTEEWMEMEMEEKTAMPTTMETCHPLNFKGTEGVVGLTRWFEKMEMVFYISNCLQKNQVKGQNVARAYMARNNKKKGYVGCFPYYNKCKLHHGGPCTMRCGICKRVGHMARDCTTVVAPNTQRALVGNQSGIVCYECGRPRNYRKDCLKLRNQNHGNKTGNKTRDNKATTKAYAI
nr:reverse transcriptase domain-containing protein [Tanacetum cinerariifolium]